MKVLNLTDIDFGGCAYRFTEALAEAGHEAKHIGMLAHIKFGYEHGLLSKDANVVEKWVKWADMVNCWSKLKPLQGVLWPKPGSRLFFIAVGSIYWDDHEEIHERSCRDGFTILSLSAAMLKWGAKWLPSPVPVERWRKLKRRREGENPVVCQTPSYPEGKNTDKIKAVLAWKTDIDFRVIVGVLHKQCMEAKAVADICLGQFRTRGGEGGGYGLSELEAMAMKIPVITISPDWIEESYMDEIGYLPYYRSELEDLPEAIDVLMSDQALYDEYANRGFEYVLKFHDYPVVVKRFEELCCG